MLMFRDKERQDCDARVSLQWRGRGHRILDPEDLRHQIKRRLTVSAKRMGYVIRYRHSEPHEVIFEVMEKPNLMLPYRHQ